MLRVEIRRGDDALPDLRPAWESLHLLAAGSPFQSFAWQQSWAETFGRRREPIVALFFHGSDLVGLMPWVRIPGPLPIVRSMGVGPSDILDPMVAPGYFGPVTAALSEAVACIPDVVGADLPELRSPLGEGGLPQSMAWQIRLPRTFAEYERRLGKSLRADLRRDWPGQIDRLAASELESGLEVLMELHARRWRRRGFPGVFFGPMREFQRRWVARVASDDVLRLYRLRLEGETVGMLYAMSAAGRTMYYQAGFDPLAARHSPGTRMIGHAIREAIHEGDGEFDFLRGDEAYKRRWKPDHSITHRRVFLSPRGRQGKAAASLLAWRQRSLGWARRQLGL